MAPFFATTAADFARLRGGTAGPEPELDEFLFAGKQIDFRAQMLRWDGMEQQLTLMEATLLGYLVRCRYLHCIVGQCVLCAVWLCAHCVELCPRCDAQ